MAQPQQKPEKRTTGRAQPPVPRGFMFWWLISLALLIWYVSGLSTRSQSKAAIPYSLFLTQVQQNNVSEVHIAGDVIEGKFVKQIVWPQPESPAEKSSKPIQAPSSSPSGVAGTSRHCIQRIHHDLSRDRGRPKCDASAHCTPCRRGCVVVFNSMVHRAAGHLGTAGASVRVLLVDEQPSRT